ncbi:hypothetical protein O181_094737 [Austropuccinia psidii MF-1]|uniref:Uncharacterized protein n=1 Tax=Austropuccinia psidii MF-1 TaxID=1389203 RepID=A0A9Q3PBT4_9BASI|nr:hypothetical protein [Austropuccinia psidii MF-1]
MPVQKLVQSSQRRGVGNMPKPLSGGHELLLTHQELSGSGEDHRTPRMVEHTALQRQGQKDKELVEETKSLYINQKKELEMTPDLEKDSPVASTSSGSVRRQAQRNSEETDSSQELSRKGQMQSQLTQTLPKRVQDPQIGAFRSG